MKFFEWVIFPFFAVIFGLSTLSFSLSLCDSTKTTMAKVKTIAIIVLVIVITGLLIVLCNYEINDIKFNYITTNKSIYLSIFGYIFSLFLTCPAALILTMGAGFALLIAYIIILPLIALIFRLLRMDLHKLSPEEVWKKIKILLNMIDLDAESALGAILLGLCTLIIILTSFQALNIVNIV